MNEPTWLSIARRYIGVYETPGKETTPIISKWLINLRAWWKDDETPWCGVFVAECMRQAGVKLPAHWYRAKAWLDWGVPLDRPLLGCVVVFSRTGGGHVGLVVGRRADGRLMVLGGNQGNRVGVAPFDSDRIVGFRWPVEYLANTNQGDLPLLAATGEPISHNEA